jgi:uncharacterized Zn finger protein
MNADTIGSCVEEKKVASQRLGRLLHPMMGREEELFASLEYHVEQIEQQQRRLEALVRQVGPDNAKDRLIAFEERIQVLEAQSARGGR